MNHLILVGLDFEIYASPPFPELVGTVVSNWESLKAGKPACCGLAADWRPLKMWAPVRYCLTLGEKGSLIKWPSRGCPCKRDGGGTPICPINCPYQFVGPRTIIQSSPLVLYLNLKIINQMCSSLMLLQIYLHADIQCLVQGLSFRILGLLCVLVGKLPNP